MRKTPEARLGILVAPAALAACGSGSRAVAALRLPARRIEVRRQEVRLPRQALARRDRSADDRRAQRS